jgi:hypothetical protein
MGFNSRRALPPQQLLPAVINLELGRRQVPLVRPFAPKPKLG